jgi:hypothetical protein
MNITGWRLKRIPMVILFNRGSAASTIFLLPAFFILSVQCIYGQFYEDGQSPSSLKWRQISTDNFRLIYPETFSGHAFRLAGLLEDAYDLTGHSLSHRPDPIPVIVHNHSVRSNGLVVWAPKRMQLQTTHPHSIRGGDWLTQLAVHEQRHVVQVDKLNQGVLRFLSLFLGEQAVGISTGRIPQWFYEGDAVVAETVLTSSGRGRMPSFYMPIRTLLLDSDRFFSYDKFLHGSYRDYVPDRYQYGYQMVSAMRREYGPGIWENTLDKTARRPYYLAPFYWSIRHDAGEGITRIHEKTLSTIMGEWRSLHSGRQYDAYSRVNRRDEKLYLNYRYPAWADDSSVIALKSGIGHADQFVKISTSGNEEILFYPGPLSSSSLAVSGNLVAWSEFQPDRRWAQRSFSEIRVMDHATGKSRRISAGSRYFAPAFSPGGSVIAVVETDPGGRDNIVLLDPQTGAVKASYPSYSEVDLSHPVFSSDGKEVFVTASGYTGTSILSLAVETGDWTVLREPSFTNISRVFPCHDLICFHSDISGVDNLYAMDREEGILYQVTSSLHGAFNGDLSPDGAAMVFSDYTANGFDIVIDAFDPGSLTVFGGSSFFRDELIESLLSDETGIMGSGENDSLQWQSRPYIRGLNLFRFHSWSPFYYDYNDPDITHLPVTPGITLLSQSLLNTATTFAGYSWLDGYHLAHGRFTYKGWYPVLEAEITYGNEPQIFNGSNTIPPPDQSSSGHMNLGGSVYLPLNLSSGRYVSSLEPRIRTNWNNLNGLATVESRLLAYRYTRRSLRDLAPRWGQVLRIQRISAPLDPDLLGAINAAELTVYLPGMIAHHSLRLGGALQGQDPVNYYYANLIRLPRGYRREAMSDIRLLRGSYSFPFLYPDLSIPLPGVIYLKRLYADVFAEGGTGSLILNEGSPIQEKEPLFSWGLTVTTDLHVLRAPFPLSINTGIAHIPRRNRVAFLLSFGVEIGNF